MIVLPTLIPSLDSRMNRAEFANRLPYCRPSVLNGDLCSRAAHVPIFKEIVMQPCIEGTAGLRCTYSHNKTTFSQSPKTTIKQLEIDVNEYLWLHQ